MIIVTGGAGFIGSNLVRGLNARDQSDILVVDDLTDGTKFANLADCDIADYEDKEIYQSVLDNDQEALTLGGTWRRLVGTNGVVGIRIIDITANTAP